MPTITEANQKRIVRYLGVTSGIDPIRLGVHLAAYADDITDQTVTDVTAELTRWTDNNLDTNFVRVSGNLKNYGASINPDDLRESIRSSLAALLFLTRAKWYQSPGSTEVWMERG